MDSVPMPSIRGGDYVDHVFTEAQTTPICFPIRLVRCDFKGFRSNQPGGSFLARDTTVGAESTVWSSLVGVCGQGMMIEASSKGFAEAYLKHCIFKNCSNFLEAKANEESGGALAVFGGANCYCTDCRFVGNKAGGLFVFGSLWLKGSEVCDNCGVFGGVYVKGEVGEFVLSITFCKFEGNGGLLEGCCVHIASCVVFESEDCFFHKSDLSSICFEVVPKSVRFGSNCFKGSSVQVFSRVKVGVIVTGRLCFEGWEKHVHDNILIERLGQGVIKENCSLCNWKLDDDESLENDNRRLNRGNEVKVKIHEPWDKCVRPPECHVSSARDNFCNCVNLSFPNVTKGSLVLFNCTFRGMSSDHKFGGAIDFSGDELLAVSTSWINCSHYTGDGLAVAGGSTSATLRNCTFRV
jgi:hypothetical protein